LPCPKLIAIITESPQTGNVNMKMVLHILVIITLGVPLFSESRELFTVELKNTKDMTCWLPLDSNKFNLILYSDYRNLEENRDFYDAMKKKPEVLKKINPILVINTKPAWYIPDWFMKFRLRKVEKKYDVSTCFDNSRKLESKWRLKNCDSKSVLILLDKQNRLRYIHYGKVPVQIYEKFFKVTANGLKKIFKQTKKKLKGTGK